MANENPIYELVGESVIIEGIRWTLVAVRGSWAWFENEECEKLSMKHDEAVELLS